MTTGLWLDSVLPSGCCQDVMAREGLLHLCDEDIPTDTQPPVSLLSGLALFHLLTLRAILGQCAMSIVLFE